MSDKKDWQVNDIVQIDPMHDERFGGCFLQITELKSFGAMGFVQIPAGGQAYYRLPWNGGDKVGTAVFVLQADEGELDNVAEASYEASRQEWAERQHPNVDE